MSTIAVLTSGESGSASLIDINNNFANLNTDKLETSTASSTYAPKSSPTFTGTVVLPSTTSIGTVSNTEISYLDGVTSAIQTQIDAKGAGTVTSITASSPLTGGTITGSGSIGIQNAAADGATKGAAAFTASDFNASSGVISIDYTNGQAASGSTKGFLTSTDWTTFNNKGSGTVTSIATTAPLSGGTITGSGTITTSMATNKLIGRGTAGTGVMEEITLGTNLSLSGTTLNATGGGTPGGSDTQVQFNDGGAFGGDSGLVFNKTTNALKAGSITGLSASNFTVAADVDLTVQGGVDTNIDAGVDVNITSGGDTNHTAVGSVKIIALTGSFSFSTGGSDAILDASELTADRTFTLPNTTGTISVATSGSGAPGTTPVAIGLIYCDTSGGKAYISTGTSSSADWKILN